MRGVVIIMGNVFFLIFERKQQTSARVASSAESSPYTVREGRRSDDRVFFYLLSPIVVFWTTDVRKTAVHYYTRRNRDRDTHQKKIIEQLSRHVDITMSFFQKHF